MILRDSRYVTANFSHACCCETVTVDLLPPSAQVLHIHSIFGGTLSFSFTGPDHSSQQRDLKSVLGGSLQCI